MCQNLKKVTDLIKLCRKFLLEDNRLEDNTTIPRKTSASNHLDYYKISMKLSHGQKLLEE